MAVITTESPVQGLGRVVAGSEAKSIRPRHITPQAGHALEILGHAIEYLTDEHVRGAEEMSAHDPDVEAVQILMELNREIYYACPLQLSFAERLRAFFTH